MVQRVFVGDVQGCADELDALIERARTELGDFELLLTGDLVNRGPASFRVLERVRRLQDAGRARSVLGNHDLRLIGIGLGAFAPAPEDTLGDVLGRSDASDWVDWLRRQPLLVRGALGAMPFALVHASLAPHWTLDAASALAGELAERLADANRAAARAFVAAVHAAREVRKGADADALADALHSSGPEAQRLDALGRLISARSATPRGGWSERLPEAIRGGEPWHAAWARAGHGFGVVYGHWALQRLHVAPRLRGLDTGCVHHGRGEDGFLTAWLPDERTPDPFATPDTRFWREPARANYWR